MERFVRRSENVCDPSWVKMIFPLFQCWIRSGSRLERFVQGSNSAYGQVLTTFVPIGH